MVSTNYIRSLEPTTYTNESDKRLKSLPKKNVPIIILLKCKLLYKSSCNQSISRKFLFNISNMKFGLCNPHKSKLCVRPSLELSFSLQLRFNPLWLEFISVLRLHPLLLIVAASSLPSDTDENLINRVQPYKIRSYNWIFHLRLLYRCWYLGFVRVTWASLGLVYLVGRDYTSYSQ